MDKTPRPSSPASSAAPGAIGISSDIDMPATPVPLSHIYRLFFEIGALSFGGGLTAWLYREVVDKRKLIAEVDFLGGLTLAQVLPGINMSNLSIYVGQRLRGLTGACIALLGLVSVPFFAVIGFASIYHAIARIGALHDFLDGMAAGAVGLLLAMGAKAVRRSRMQRAQLLITALVVVLVGVLALPMIPVILVLAPISIALSYPKDGSQDRQQTGAGQGAGHA